MSNARPRGSGLSGERGAALLQMTIAMLAITAFSTFVMDYGVFWVARRQAQNAADAGALAGAIGVAFGEDPSLGGAAMLASQAAARANAVWGEPPSVLLGGLNGSTDVRINPCPDSPLHSCVTTDVFRTVQRGNPLPTYFGRLAALDQQDVQASATVEVMQANESACLQHWGIADRWVDGTPGEDWEFGATWDDAVDSYIPPDATHPGTGLQVANSAGEFCCDYGHEFVLQNQDRRNARFYGRLGFGGSGCVAGGLGDGRDRVRRFLNPSTIAGINALVDADPGACWSADAGCGTNLQSRCPLGCVYSPLHGINASPRIVVVRAFDPREVVGSGSSSQVNLVALFLEARLDPIGNPPLHVRVVVAPGTYNTQRNSLLTYEASFLRAAVLVR